MVGTLSLRMKLGYLISFLKVVNRDASESTGRLQISLNPLRLSASLHSSMFAFASLSSPSQALKFEQSKVESLTHTDAVNFVLLTKFNR